MIIRQNKAWTALLALAASLLLAASPVTRAATPEAENKAFEEARQPVHSAPPR